MMDLLPGTAAHGASGIVREETGEKVVTSKANQHKEVVMKKPRLPHRLLVVLILAASFCSVGCATMTVVPVKKLNDQQLAADVTPVAHIHLLNWGWYLFKFIPIITGDLEEAQCPQCASLFTDNVNVEDLVERLTEQAHELGGTVTTDLRTTDRSAWAPSTLIFWLNEVEVSANVSRPREELEDQR
jgi:hypothetical protein